MMRYLMILMMVVTVTACAPRGKITLVPEAETVGKRADVFVATTRKFDPQTHEYGGLRSEQETFAKYGVSVPPNRELGDIPFPGRQKPDPAKHFLTVEQTLYPDVRAFERDMADALRAHKKGERDVVIYTHGFNNTFAEGLYRIAQLRHDVGLAGVTVHYSWPSMGSALGYVADRDSATFSRDGLEQLIQAVDRAGADRIVLVAHSMGSALTMETLRQIAIRGNDRLMKRISGVVLISPDIDVDVFRMSVKAYGNRLPQPFLIFGSNNDKLLALSARLSRQPARLGNLQDMSRIKDLKVTFYNTDAYSQGTGHFNMGDNPALLKLMKRIGDINKAFDQDRRKRVGLLPGMVLSVQSATEIILSPVEDLSVALSQ